MSFTRMLSCSVLCALGAQFPSELLRYFRINSHRSFVFPFNKGSIIQKDYLNQIKSVKRSHTNCVACALTKREKMECVTSIAAGAVSKIGELLVEPIGANCDYLISYKDNITNMKDALKALQDKKQEVQLRMYEDKNNGREIVPRVEEWLREVEAIQGVLARFNEDEANRNNKCVAGWCPNLKTRYSFSRRAKKNTDKLVRLKEKKPETISTPAAPLKYGAFFTSKGIKSFESRDNIIRGVIEKLKEEGCNRFSICGMGGVGKTTLVKEVIKIVESEKLFGHVVMVVVSQTVDYRKIQGEIADRLDITLSKESQQGRAEQLLGGIINKSAGVLIVLDDVWTELNFESIGLPSNGDHKACKVIFTSRNEGACYKMGSQKTFIVNTLSKGDSWALFQEIIGGDVVNNSDIRPIAEEIANECGGLPIAIVTVGKALLAKRDKYAWEDALNDLRRSSASLSEVEKCIELSYNLLDKEIAKYLLFLCCLYPEDADIPIEDLLREGWGLGLFQDQDSLCEARSKTHTLMNDLKTCYLLLDSDEKECVKMHDVVRDVITSIASKKENDFKIQCVAENWWQEKSTRNSSSAISIRTNEVKECPNVAEYPKLELLRVGRSSPWIDEISIPTNFFQGMRKLKVLYLRGSHIPNLSPLFPALNYLRTLRLELCQVGDASIIGKELLALEILSFAWSSITELPNEIGQLGSLRLLDLTGCDKLCRISSNVLARLLRLEELYFRVENFPWMQNTDFILELRTISNQLKVVEIKLRKVESFFKDLIFENVRRFWVSVVPYVFDGLYAISGPLGYMDRNILRLRAVNYNSIKCSLTIKHLVKRCEVLIIENVKNLKNIVRELEEGAGFPCLKVLKVNICSNLEYLIDDGEIQKSMTNFSNLEKLELKHIPKLICFRKVNDLNKPNQSMLHQFPSLETMLLENCSSLAMVFDLQGFQNLRVLSISICDSLTHIFSPAVGEGMPQLEKLHVMRCSKMANLVGGSKDHEVEESNSKGKAKTVVFNKLNHLSLSDLPKLESICANSYKQEWPSLRHLSIDDCPMLKTPSFQNQILQESNSLDMVFDLQGFKNLRALTVSNCDSLTHIFTRAIGRVAPELEELKIKSCKQMASLVRGSKGHEEEDYKARGKVNNIVFNRLYSLSLFDLPKLESICSYSYYDLKWPSLRQLNIDRCPKLKTTSFQNHMLVMQDNAEATSYSNIHSINFGNKSKPSNWILRCAPLLPKFIQQANTNKTSNKAATTAQDQVSSSFRMESMPIVEDISVIGCGLLDVMFLLEENYNATILSYLKTIKIEDYEKLESIIAKRGKRTGMMNCFTQLQSLNLKNLPNLVRLCFFGTCTSLHKHEDMDACDGDQRQIRLDPLIDVFLFTNLRSLFIMGCNKICILFSPSSLRSLKFLEKLDLQDCKNIEEIISQEEKEGTTTKIMLPELKHILFQGLPKLKAFSHASDDFNFPSLQKVHIEGCPNMEVFSRGSSNTPKLEDFEIKTDPHGSKYIHKKDLNATIKGFKAFVELQSSEMLSWNGHHNEGIIYFINAEMDIKMFHKLLMIIPFNETRMLQNVRKLNIAECDLLLEVFESIEAVDAKERDETIHCELGSMNLKKLPKLRHIWGPNLLRLVSFDRLTSINIISCHSLKSLMSHSMAKKLVHLKELCIKDCKMMEEIVTKEHENRDKVSKIKTLFPKLKCLALDDLPELQCFCSGDYNYDLPLCDGEERKIEKMDVVECKNLFGLASFIEIHTLQHVRELNIINCYSLKEVFESGGGSDANKGDVITHYEIESMKLKGLSNLRHIWGPNIKSLVSFEKLTSIHIEECHSLKSLLSYSMAGNLVLLQGLYVWHCDMMEVIVTMEDENIDNKGSKVKNLFPNLRTLDLSGLPKLEYICSLDSGYDIPLCNEEEDSKEINNNQHIQISFPQLDEVILDEVPSLKCFCPGAYDYHLMLSSSCVEDRTLGSSFPNGKVTISTPKLYAVYKGYDKWLMPTMGDLNLTIHCFHNEEKYKVELQSVDTFRCIEQHKYRHLLAYVKREPRLVLESCHKLLTCFPSDMMHLFQHLQALYVVQCGCLEEIFESNDYEGINLYWMQLLSLPKLRHIWSSHGPVSGFKSLSFLIISECHDLKFVFPDVSIAMSLPQLGTLGVCECNQMEEIIQNEKKNNDSSIPKVPKIIFRGLRRIELYKLPKLNCFCQGSFYFELPQCGSIRITECPKMETFCNGTLYAPWLESSDVEGMVFDGEEEVNEVIQEIRRR